VLAGAEQESLEQLYRSLNPVSLLRQINENLERLWDTAEHPINKQGEVKTYQASVTVYFDATRNSGGKIKIFFDFLQRR